MLIYYIDAAPNIRLITIHSSGDALIYTLSRSESNEWSVLPRPFKTEMICPVPGGLFVLNGNSGVILNADKTHLVSVLNKEPPKLVRKGSNSDPPGSVLVVVGAKSARSYRDLDGDKRIGKAEWSAKSVGNVIAAQIIERNCTQTSEYKCAVR